MGAASNADGDGQTVEAGTKAGFEAGTKAEAAATTIKTQRVKNLVIVLVVFFGFV